MIVPAGIDVLPVQMGIRILSKGYHKNRNISTRSSNNNSCFINQQYILPVYGKI
jgi:hypothetical protein